MAVLIKRFIDVLILGKKLLQNFTSSGDGSEKVQKQGTSAKVHKRCRVVFLHSFISALLAAVLFKVLPYLKRSFEETFSLVSVPFQRVLNQLSNRGQMCLVLEINALKT